MKCKWCLNQFDLSDKPKGWAANHVRWCESNPKKEDYLNALKSGPLDRVKMMNDAKKVSGITNSFTKARILGYIYENPLKGKPNLACRGKKFTLQQRANMSRAALKSTHRRLRRGIINYNGIMLDSSWELELAKRLDQLNISWIRPTPLKWKDQNNTTHNYFPDFYLPNYNLYLDPKNPYAYLVQKKKIEILLNTYSNIKFLKSLDECKQFKL